MTERTGCLPAFYSLWLQMEGVLRWMFIYPPKEQAISVLSGRFEAWDLRIHYQRASERHTTLNISLKDAFFTLVCCRCLGSRLAENCRKHPKSEDTPGWSACEIVYSLQFSELLHWILYVQSSCMFWKSWKLPSTWEYSSVITNWWFVSVHIPIWSCWRKLWGQQFDRYPEQQVEDIRSHEWPLNNWTISKE